MVLKCKLQKAVQTTERSDKFLFGFFSLFNPSQLFLILSFLGVVGLYFWFQANSSPQEEEEKKEEKDAKETRTATADQDESPYNPEDIKERKRQLTELRHQQVRQIETIYESHLEEVTSADDTQTNKIQFEIQQTIEETNSQVLETVPSPPVKIDEPTVEATPTSQVPISESIIEVVPSQEQPISESTYEVISPPQVEEPIVQVALPTSLAEPVIPEVSILKENTASNKTLTIDQTIDIITGQMAAKTPEDLTNPERNASRLSFLSEISSDELTELSSDENNERLFEHLNYNAIEQAIDMVSNYSTRVNKISGPSENNEISTSSCRSTVAALDQELLINEKTVEQAISLISTIKSQHQLQINSESTSASTITLTKETASDSSEKLNDYVIVSKEEAAEAPNEPATSEPLNPSEEEDKEINLIADAIQAITNEMKSALVAETRVGRETVETIVHEESISEKKTYTSNMQSVLERIKETLDETQKFLDESEKQTVMLPEEPSPVFRAELNKENEIIDEETSQIISVAEAIKEITNEMTAIVKETVASIKEELDEVTDQTIFNTEESLDKKLVDQTEESFQLEKVQEVTSQQVEEIHAESKVASEKSAQADPQQLTVKIEEVVSQVSPDTTTTYQSNLVAETNNSEEMSSSSGFVPKTVEEILPIISDVENLLFAQTNNVSEQIRHSFEMINCLSSGGLKVKFQISKSGSRAVTPEAPIDSHETVHGSDLELNEQREALIETHHEEAIHEESREAADLSSAALAEAETSLQAILEEKNVQANETEQSAAEAVETPAIAKVKTSEINESANTSSVTVESNVEEKQIDEALVSEYINKIISTSASVVESSVNEIQQQINEIAATIIETFSQTSTADQVSESTQQHLEQSTTTLVEETLQSHSEILASSQVAESSSRSVQESFIESTISQNIETEQQQEIAIQHEVSIHKEIEIQQEISSSNKTTVVEETLSAEIKVKSEEIHQETKYEQVETTASSVQVVEQTSFSNISATTLESKSEETVEKTEKAKTSGSESPENKPLEKRQNSLLELFNAKHIHAIEDHFNNLNEISEAIKRAGLEKSQLVFGIDFTISNLENGTRTFNGRSLHYFDNEIRNPYQKVIEILGKTLEIFDVDGRIPAYGFGDAKTKDRKVFPFSPSGYCLGFNDVLKKYNEILKEIKLSGPTNFAPLIKETIRIVKETNQYHILVILADGQVTNERQTREAIVEASNYPISIIMVGVGDGPWDMMTEFDDSIPKRQFDNFQFVNYHEVISESGSPDERFALHALMEIPDQYKAIKELRLLKE